MKPALNSDCETLNRRYGAPERIVFRPSESGCPVVTLANKFGSLEISLFGAQVLDYRPTGQVPVLYRPPEMAFAPLDEVHGGIPVCWPWFGGCGEPGQGKHGFARYACWEVRRTEYSEEMNEITLGLVSSPATKDLWPHDFDLEYTLTLSRKLTLALTTRNTGTEPCRYTEGFHPYFRVRDVRTVSVRGVEGLRRGDPPSYAPDNEQPGDFRPEGRHVDAVFTEGPRQHALLDPTLRRAIAVVSRGNAKLVVWNPGPLERARGNIPASEWDRFLCVEPATLFRDAAVELKPGESHQLVCAIQAVTEGAAAEAD